MKYYCEIYQCYFCGLIDKNPSKSKKFRSIIETHHILEQHLGGTDHPSNLVRCCSTCHSKIHNNIIVLEKYYDIGYAKYLKWVDEHGKDQFGPNKKPTE